jgi:hypothetical protein
VYLEVDQEIALVAGCGLVERLFDGPQLQEPVGRELAGPFGWT